jgi:hypothetical protein
MTSRFPILFIMALFTISQFMYLQRYPVFIDFVIFVFFSMTWMFCKYRSSQKYLISISCFYGAFFALILGYGMAPTAFQSGKYKQYEENNNLHEILEKSYYGEAPSSYFAMERLFVELAIKGFSLKPPSPVRLVDLHED